MWLYDDGRLCFVCLFAAPVTLNTMNSGRYDDSFIDQLPRLLPIMSEMDRKLLPLSKAIRKKYFRNVDLDQEDQFRPKYVEVHNSQLTEQLLALYLSRLKHEAISTFKTKQFRPLFDK